VFLMCFSAVYLQHHYVIDAIVGLIYAAITVVAMLAWERRSAARAAAAVAQTAPAAAAPAA